MRSRVVVVATAAWAVAALTLGTLLVPAQASGAAPAAERTMTAAVEDTGVVPGENDPATAVPVSISYGANTAQYYLAWIPPRPTTRSAVAVVHGGFWISGSPSSVAELNRKLYAEGIPSFSIGYRLASAAAWPAQRTDALSALASIRRQAAGFGIDGRNIALIGSSAGGHIALSVASGAGRAQICAAVTYSAPTSINVVRSDGAGDYRREMLATASAKLAPSATQTRSATLPTTPGRADAPALLFAAQREWLPYVQSSLYVQRYRGTGLEVRPVILSGISEHAMKYALTQPLVWRLTTQFIAKHC